MNNKVYILTYKVYFLIYYFADPRRNEDWLKTRCLTAAKVFA